MSRTTDRKKSNPLTQDFSQNYQKAFNNYSNIIKFYTDNILIMDAIEKIISSYKECALVFKKKLIQLKLSFIRPFYDDEKKVFKFQEESYSFDNNLILTLNEILNFEINSISNVISNLENTIFPEVEKKRIYDYSMALQQSKNTMQTKIKIMEKLYVEYNNEYKKFYENFDEIEEKVQKYYVNTRKKIVKDPKFLVVKGLLSDAIMAQTPFLQAHNRFQDNNKKFFKSYTEKMAEIEKEIKNNDNYMDFNINSFVLSLKNSNFSFLNYLNNYLNKKNSSAKETPDKDMTNSSMDIFRKQYLIPVQTEYQNEKYKVRAVHCNIIGDNQPLEEKEMMNSLFNEMGLEEYMVETSNIVLTDEDVFQTLKFFYGPFDYVDTSEYDLILEKKKLDVKYLTNNLLQFGLKKKEPEEFKDLKPINDNDINKLENLIKSKKEYRLSFLFRFNFYRTLGIFDMPQREFEITTKFFQEITDCIYDEREDDKDFSTFKLLIILSQTFYINKDGEKYYLIKTIRGHKLFNDINYIKRYLNYCINEEIEKSKKKSKIEISDKAKQDIIFATMLPFCNYMNEFGVSKPVLLEIIDSVCKEYKLSEDLRNNINMIIG